jgi:hypothetical protein
MQPSLNPYLDNFATPRYKRIPRTTSIESDAKVAELVDAQDSGSCGVTPVGVRLPSFAPGKISTHALLSLTSTFAS